MIKTIKVKKVFTFRELMEYIIQNDVSGTFKNCDGHQFKVDKHGTFNFAAYSYGLGEIYEIEIEEEITENTKFQQLIEVAKGDIIRIFGQDITINELLDENSKVFYTLIDGELVKIWECE